MRFFLFDNSTGGGFDASKLVKVNGNPKFVLSKNLFF